MTLADAAISSLLVASCVVAAASRRWPVAAALAALCVLGGARLVATPVLDAAAEPYVGAALWALRVEAAVIAWWPWPMACLVVAVVRRSRAVVVPAPRRDLDGDEPQDTAPPGDGGGGGLWLAGGGGAVHAPEGAPRPRLAQALALAAGSLLASCALAAAYPWLQGAALLAWYPRSRVAALVVAAGVVWRRLRVERDASGKLRAGDRGGDLVQARESAKGELLDGADPRSDVRDPRRGVVLGRRAVGDHARSVALAGDEVPALVLAAEQAWQLLLWGVGPARVAEVWRYVDGVSVAGYAALLVVLVGQAFRRR